MGTIIARVCAKRLLGVFVSAVTIPIGRASRLLLYLFSCSSKIGDVLLVSGILQSSMGQSVKDGPAGGATWLHRIWRAAGARPLENSP